MEIKSDAVSLPASARSSRIAVGNIRHRRFTPISREFRHSVSYFFLDLKELYEWKWLHTQPFLYFRRSDYYRPEVPSLYEAVAQNYQKQTGKPWSGKIFLLTQLCQFGFGFNPVSFYFGFRDSLDQPNFILSEITNTPWNERHTYWSFPSESVDSASHVLKDHFPKKFHVSPFLGMNYQYSWNFSVLRKGKSERITIHLENIHAETKQKDFDATLTLALRPADFRHWLGRLIFSPLMTFKSVFWIYLHAGILFLKKVPFFAHPKNLK